MTQRAGFPAAEKACLQTARAAGLSSRRGTRGAHSTSHRRHTSRASWRPRRRRPSPGSPARGSSPARAKPARGASWPPTLRGKRSRVVFPTPRSRASGSAAAPVTLGVALLSAQRRSSRAVFARARRERAPDPDPDDRRLPRNGRDDEREGDDDRPHAGRDDDDVDRDETDEAFADTSDEWDSTCDPGQLRLNLVAAVAGSQNPRNAHVLEHLFERWRAFQLDVSTADDVTRAAELRFLAHHPAECAAAALALAVIHRAWSRTRSRVRALKAELLAEGVDLTHVDDKVETLSYLRRMRDKGTLALGLEACAARRAEAEVRFLGPNALASWREYYGERDIDLARASDMERVRRYVADLHHLEGCLLGIDLQATASEGGGFGGGGCGRS